MVEVRQEIVPPSRLNLKNRSPRYLAKLPRHELMFSLGDFDLVRLTPAGGMLNGGFGKAYRLRPEDLA